jgi:hypothetical protein
MGFMKMKLCWLGVRLRRTRREYTPHGQDAPCHDERSERKPGDERPRAMGFMKMKMKLDGLCAARARARKELRPARCVSRRIVPAASHMLFCRNL